MDSAAPIFTAPFYTGYMAVPSGYEGNHVHRPATATPFQSASSSEGSYDHPRRRCSHSRARSQSRSHPRRQNKSGNKSKSQRRSGGTSRILHDLFSSSGSSRTWDKHGRETGLLRRKGDQNHENYHLVASDATETKRSKSRRRSQSRSRRRSDPIMRNVPMQTHANVSGGQYVYVQPEFTTPSRNTMRSGGVQGMPHVTPATFPSSQSCRPGWENRRQQQQQRQATPSRRGGPAEGGWQNWDDEEVEEEEEEEEEEDDGGRRTREDLLEQENVVLKREVELRRREAERMEEENKQLREDFGRMRTSSAERSSGWADFERRRERAAEAARTSTGEENSRPAASSRRKKRVSFTE